jgi:hypothetical protein
MVYSGACACVLPTVRHGAVEVRACGRGPVNVVERRRLRAVPERALQQRSASASASATQAHNQHTYDEVKGAVW